MINNNILIKIINILSNGSIFFPENFGINSKNIYKYINIIKNWGIIVNKCSNNSYRIDYPLNLLNKKKILSNISNGRVDIISVTNSTNEYLIKRVNKLKSGDVCIAEHQINGKGKYGRKWVSTFGRNIYFSMFWFLKNGFKSTYGLSIITGFVIAEVLYKLGLSEIFIKWPNDLYIKNKKLAGILIEIFGNTNSSVQVIIGVGINLNIPNKNIFNLKNNIIDLKETGINFDRNNLIIDLINSLKKSLKDFEYKKFLYSIPQWNLIKNF